MKSLAAQTAVKLEVLLPQIRPFGGVEDLSDGQHHHQSLERQREAALFSSLRNIRQADSVIRTLFPRYAGMQVGFILKEVQMAPGFLFDTMRFARLPTFGKGKGMAPLEIHEKVQPLGFRIELRITHVPRVNKTQPQLKKSFFHSFPHFILPIQNVEEPFSFPVR